MGATMWAMALLIACSGGSPATEAAAIANEIEKDPANADAVLKKHGTTAAAFEAQLYEIAADPAQTDEYLSARK
jgi:hypothetical protein